MQLSWRNIATAALAVAFVSGAAVARLKPDTSSIHIEGIEVSASKLTSFDKAGGNKSIYGQLEWRGGVVLSSSSANFGGWSGLALDADGKRLIAVSDAGTWMTADIVREEGRLVGLKAARIGPLKARGDKPLRRERDRDAEGMALVDGDLTRGVLLVAFEQNDRIGRFTVNKGQIAPPASYLVMPPEVERMKRDGFEGLTVLRGGPLKGFILALAEHPLPGDEEHLGWIWTPGGKDPKRFTLAGIGDYGVTDVASLSDGSLLLLERRYTLRDGVRMRLRKVESSAVVAGGKIAGKVLIEADMRHEIDNMEGLAVREKPSGEILITLISDDNFNRQMQRTLMLEFALVAAPARSADNETASALGKER